LEIIAESVLAVERSSAAPRGGIKLMQLHNPHLHKTCRQDRTKQFHCVSLPFVH